MELNRIELSKKKLLDRYQRVVDGNIDNRYLLIKQLWNFLHSDESFKLFSINLDSEEVHIKNFYQSQSMRIVRTDEPIPLPESEKDRITIAYYVIKELMGTEIHFDEIYQIGWRYSTNKNSFENEYFSTFNLLFLQPLIFHYHDEATMNFSIVSLLMNYKKKVEWFRKKEVSNLFNSDTKKGEENLTLHLYEFLFDSGIEFTIEPKSPSGKVDFIVAQKNSSNKLLADGKIFEPSGRGKSYIIKGIGQLLAYLKEYNETYGYLVIYKVNEENIEFNFNSNSHLLPSLFKDNKVIYFLVVDIFENNNSASKRGIPKTISISVEDVNKEIDGGTIN